MQLDAAMTAGPATSSVGRIELRGVGKHFGAFEALRPVEATIEAGEFVSVVGPSGCGKSTLMLLTAGLLAPTEGEVVVDGRRLARPLTRVGIVFQDALLLDFRDALDNVLLQAQIRGMSVADARGIAQESSRGSGSRAPSIATLCSCPAACGSACLSPGHSSTILRSC